MLWFLFVLLLTTASVGLSGLFGLFCIMSAFIMGCFSVPYLSSMFFSSRRLVVALLSPHRLILCRSPKINSKHNYSRRRRLHRFDNILPIITGFEEIDNQIHDILHLIFRHSIYPWHKNLITCSDEFPTCLQEILYGILTNLSSRIKRVDWVTFITTRLVDDVASHVRLFKRARSRILNAGDDVQSTMHPSLPELESLFFDSEVAMEDGMVCRDLVSCVQQQEIEFMQDISEIILFILLSKDDFKAYSLRLLARELLVNVLLKPAFDILSDPDFINDNLIWLFSHTNVPPDVFIMTVRYSKCVEELQATREIVNRDICQLRSNDAKSDFDSSLKQQLNSLLYFRKVIDARIHQLQKGNENHSLGLLPACVDWHQMLPATSNEKLNSLFDMSIELLLNNNIALSYFIDYMTSIGSQSYLFFFLNVKGWVISAEQQLQALETTDAITKDEVINNVVLATEQSRRRDTVMENLRESSHSIYCDYLSEKATPRLRLDDVGERAVKRLLFRIRTEPPSVRWFDETRQLVVERLRTDERFLGGFKKTVGYLKLLAELDLLGKSEDDEDNDVESGEYAGSIYDVRINSNTDDINKSESLSLDGCVSSKSVRTSHQRGNSCSFMPVNTVQRMEDDHDGALNHSVTSVLSAEIIDFDTVKDSAGRPYVVYLLVVHSKDKNNCKQVVQIERRYSDFHTLHELVGSVCPNLSKLAFPGKKTFGNLDKNVVVRRRKMLDEYLKELLKLEILQQNPGLLELLQCFLHEGSYDVVVASNAVYKAVDSMKSSVKNVSQAVTAVPTQLLNTVDTVMDGISKAWQGGNDEDSSAMKVGASLDVESSENIPLRIMLLFMNEVFDLQERNQWLRRQIVAILRQIIKAMFGDIVNRRIIDYFGQLMLPDVLAKHLQNLKSCIWPGGSPAPTRNAKDEQAQLRTRVAARATLFARMPDDLRRVIGSETLRSGLNMLFDLAQRPVLNRRLLFVLLEGILENIFEISEINFPEIFRKLYSRSSRVANGRRGSKTRGFRPRQ